MRYILITGIITVLFSSARAQDRIVRINNDTIRAYIVDITKNKVKYIFNDNVDAQVFEISKSLVKQLLFENGNKITIITNPYEASNEMLLPEHPHAIKAELFSAFFNHFTVAYEMRLKKTVNLELKGGLIATSIHKGLKHSEGFFVKGGVKFVSLTKSFMNGIEYVQPLEGFYLKPEFIFDQYTQNDYERKVNFTCFAVNMLLGKQKVYGNRVILDFFGGLGAGYQNSSRDDLSYAYSHIYFGKKLPLVISGGIMMGFAF